MDSRYNHTEIESKIYTLWEKTDAFNPDVSAGVVRKNSKKDTPINPFSIIMPPPNANDPLHIGHAMFVSLEDILTRFHRMRGDTTAWIPGTDHAGIETQFVYEKKLKKIGKSRFDFDRQTLYKQIMEYVKENSGIAIDQIKKLGASADWSRFKFTLDEDVVAYVMETFKKLADDNLVYRDQQLVHFCVHCGTSFSELEVNHIDQTTSLYYVKYRMAENPAEFITLATTRPEPIWADTHLAVHPKNKKTAHLIGKKVLNPLTDEEMTIIADEFVDPEFGTGIVKLTPAHDFNDFAVAKKHDLPLIQAIDRRGKMTPGAGKYAGLSAAKAREAIVLELKEKDLIEKIDEKYQNRIGTCYRCGRVLEPLLLPQFFIRVNDPKKNLTKNALKALDTQETVVYGAGREKILRHWLENLKDWNISRQIVWGIRIPVWYEVEGYEEQITVTFVAPNKELRQGTLEELLKEFKFEEIETGLQQMSAEINVPYTISPQKVNEAKLYIAETDTFDTWFSSAQWPVVTLKTNKTADFDTFYPTTVMETGYDILPFWVMRMMLMGIYLTGKSPFKEVYLHGLVRDSKGQKMSKSKGNVINPLEVVNTFGADALRMALVIRSTPGLDKSVSEQDFKAMRNFSNKIWNASRFILLKETGKSAINSEDQGGNQDSSAKTGAVSASPEFKAPQDTTAADTAFTEKLASISVEVTEHLKNRKIGLAADVLYDTFWHWFCDQCIEQEKKGELSRKVLQAGLITYLKLLHPFMPFVTEAIWQELHAEKAFTETESPALYLITTPWPN